MPEELSQFITPVLISLLGLFIRREFQRMDEHFRADRILHDSHHTRLTVIETACQLHPGLRPAKKPPVDID